MVVLKFVASTIVVETIVTAGGDLAVDNHVIEEGRSCLPHILSGDIQAGFETGWLPGSPRDAGFISTDANAKDVFGLHTGCRKCLEGTGDA